VIAAIARDRKTSPKTSKHGGKPANAAADETILIHLVIRSSVFIRGKVCFSDLSMSRSPDPFAPVASFAVTFKQMLSIRNTTAADASLILDFIRRLAEYERDPNAVIATEDDLVRHGFGPEPKYRCLIAEWDGRPAGFALFHYNFSTWRGQPGLYLEDLFVLPEMRGEGIGKALLQRLAQIALEENCYGLRWMVLEWNGPALKFYESLGAELLGEWETMLLRCPALARLANSPEASELSSTEIKLSGSPE
jgi:GNAT superfamily N-acetyltransferase